MVTCERKICLSMDKLLQTSGLDDYTRTKDDPFSFEEFFCLFTAVLKDNLCLFSLINYIHNPKMLPCLSYVYWAKYNQSTNGVNGYGQHPIAAFI